MNAISNTHAEEPPPIEITILDQQDQDSDEFIPNESDVTTWVMQAMQNHRGANEVAIVFVSPEQMQAYNTEFRHIEKPTNVLSFPADDDEMLGDILMCPNIINQEATADDKTSLQHWAHITIHGILHLLGFDHIDDASAAIMESKETQLLTELGFNNPYL